MLICQCHSLISWKFTSIEVYLLLMEAGVVLSKITKGLDRSRSFVAYNSNRYTQATCHIGLLDAVNISEEISSHREALTEFRCLQSIVVQEGSDATPVGPTKVASAGNGLHKVVRQVTRNLQINQAVK